VSAAVISSCGKYRYSLHRALSGDLLATNVGKGTVLFVMLNPSTADACDDDPTIRRCIGFAKAWGYDMLSVGNLYAFRATDPRKLATAEDPVGPENYTHLRRLAMDAAEVVVAWGVPPIDVDEGLHMARVLGVLGPTRALGVTKAGYPRHPLYMRADAELQGWPADGDATPVSDSNPQPERTK
jgi:hypothetical protein